MSNWWHGWIIGTLLTALSDSGSGEEAMSEKELSERARAAADDKAHRWVAWCLTRRIFAPYVKSNVLARLQPARRAATEGPDAFLDSEMPFLNMAIRELCDRDELFDEAECFLGLYWYRANIKVLAHQQQCARGTVYNRARRFASRAAVLGSSIRRKHERLGLDQVFNPIEQNSCSVD